MRNDGHQDENQIPRPGRNIDWCVSGVSHSDAHSSNQMSPGIEHNGNNDGRAQEGNNPTPHRLMANKSCGTIVAKLGSNNHGDTENCLPCDPGNAESGKQISFLISTPRFPAYVPKGSKAGAPFCFNDVDGDLSNGTPTQPGYYPLKGKGRGQVSQRSNYYHS